MLVFSQQQHQEDPFITCGPFNPNLPWDVVGLYDYNVSEALKPDTYKLDTVMILLCNTDLEVLKKDNFPPVLEAKAKLCYSNSSGKGKEQLKIWSTENAAGQRTILIRCCIQQVEDVSRDQLSIR